MLREVSQRETNNVWFSLDRESRKQDNRTHTRKQKQGSEMFKLDFYVFANSLPKNFKHYSISSHVPFIQLPQMLTLLYYYSMIVQTRNFT